MSTQPIERRRLPAVRRRRPEAGRVVTIGLVFAVIFAAAFLLGHTRAGTGDLAERLPPSLPTVATPIPAALSSVPPLELGVAATPPAKSRAPAEATGTATGTTTTAAPLPAAIAPVVAPKASAPTTKAKPNPVTSPGTGGSSAPGSAKGGSGSNQGSSFDSSG